MNLTTTTTRFAATLCRLPPCRFRSLKTIADSGHFNGPESTDSFCSKALKLSAKMGFLDLGRQVHVHVMKLGLSNVLSLQNQILNVYVKCKSCHDAHRLLDEMLVRNLVTWNTLICGLADYWSNYESSLDKCFSYFRRMLLDGVGWDPITFNGLLRACQGLKDIGIGRQVHCFTLKLGLDLNCFVSSALVELYGKCGRTNEARRAFDSVLRRDTVLWNVMVACYALNGLAEEAFRVFSSMRMENLLGDGFTFSSLLNACGTMESSAFGRQIHGIIIKLSFDSDVMVTTGLIDMYAKSENVDIARKAFDLMTVRNVVSWNAMIVGYGQHGRGYEAMQLFQEMRFEKFGPDEITLASIVSSCGSESATSEVMQVHACVVKNGFHAFLSIANALIDAYSKCGTITSSLQCFTAVPDPDLVTWTSLIGAYAFHGSPEDSINVFKKMLSSGARPDRIAFLMVLSACAHAGFVTEGLHYFSLMIRKYQIMPDVEHYSCLIDLLGRAGLMEEAFDVLTSMPMEAGCDGLGAFIGACKIHDDVKFARWTARILFEKEPNKPVNYIVMSNVHASIRDWQVVARLQQVMRSKCDSRVPGYSRVDVIDAKIS